jgi:hypothetical protein
LQQQAFVEIAILDDWKDPVRDLWERSKCVVDISQAYPCDGVALRWVRSEISPSYKSNYAVPEDPATALRAEVSEKILWYHTLKRLGDWGKTMAWDKDLEKTEWLDWWAEGEELTGLKLY